MQTRYFKSTLYLFAGLFLLGSSPLRAQTDEVIMACNLWVEPTDSPAQQTAVDTGAWIRQGIEFMEMGSYNEALELFEKVIDTDPTHSKSFDLISQCYEAHGDFHNALKYLIKSYSIDNKDFHDSRVLALEARITPKNRFD